MVPEKYANVTVLTKANVYFEGRVVSHTVLLPDGSKKTLGLIFPGSYHFGTELAELMEIVSGECFVTLAGEEVSQRHTVGETFHVAARSGFDIEVREGICEYICSFLP